MIFVQGHKSGMDAAALAVASQHIAQQSRGEAACAVMSARWAEKSLCDAVACALMSAHKAAQCIAEAARAVASQHLAQQSQRVTFPQFEFRYQ